MSSERAAKDVISSGASRSETWRVTWENRDRLEDPKTRGWRSHGRNHHGNAIAARQDFEYLSSRPETRVRNVRIEQRVVLDTGWVSQAPIDWEEVNRDQ